jgi:AraC-like DNA-binding protein
MPRAREDPVRGLLTLSPGDPRVALARYLPSSPVADFVEHYWIVRWTLAHGETFTSENLPYPSVHVVFETGRPPYVQGVTTGKFTRTLVDTGGVFGIKFKPGGFRPLLTYSVSSLTDRTIPLDEILPFARELAAAMSNDVPDAELVAGVEAVLSAHVPAPDPTVALLTSLCDRVAEDRSIVRVDQLLPLCGMKRRALERLFAEYVGVSPKWVIQRYRLFEAADRLASGESTGATLAAELGYFDQAHFIRDFKRLVGATPQSFARSR